MFINSTVSSMKNQVRQRSNNVHYYMKFNVSVLMRGQLYPVGLLL